MRLKAGQMLINASSKRKSCKVNDVDNHPE